jgi:putative Holliday junction resolvase
VTHHFTPETENVDLFVVGLPFNKDGKEQEMTFIAKSFGRKLTNRYKLETVFIDEYFFSWWLSWLNQH